ncbi:MAG: hypothetical protein EBY17_06235 [Acidobacteriia bacterium]|nr:hypothetical protein [Terriglobia bacterium]
MSYKLQACKSNQDDCKRDRRHEPAQNRLTGLASPGEAKRRSEGLQIRQFGGAGAAKSNVFQALPVRGVRRVTDQTFQLLKRKVFGPKSTY